MTRRTATAPVAGYSGTPLAKKLGIKPGGRVHVVSPPSNYRSLLAPLPSNVKFVRRVDPNVDVLHVFTTSEGHLRSLLPTVIRTMRPDAAVWVSWPKKASKVPTNITEDTIRAVALPLGLVDVKVCAVDEVWSGLKLVVRKEHR